jgi:hypothetical protein
MRKLLTLSSIYLFFTILSGLVRTEVLIQTTDPQMISIIRTSGHLTNVLNSIFSIMTFALLITFVWYILQTFTQNLTKEDIIRSSSFIAIVGIIGEIFKVFLTLLFLPDEISGHIFENIEDFNAFVGTTDWFWLHSMSNIFFIVLGILLFIRDLKIESNASWKEVSVASSLMLGVMLLLNIF